MEIDDSRRSVDCVLQDHHAIVTFNNIRRHNAMSMSMWSQLSDIMVDLENNNDVRVVVFRGAGDKAFVSGADISEFDDQRSSETLAQSYEEVCEAADRAVSEFPKPTIARIQGYCIGGGLGLALACDLRICSDDASFTMPAGKLSLGYSYRDANRIIRMLGETKAFEMFYTARRFSAQEILDMGLVNTVVAMDALDKEVADWVDRISANAPLSLSAFKACAVTRAREEENVAHVQARQLIDRCFSSSDYVEARQAFAEKRKPQFKGC